jgi:hypothetical protein
MAIVLAETMVESARIPGHLSAAGGNSLAPSSQSALSPGTLLAQFVSAPMEYDSIPAATE